jgi:hypothetical protein
LERDQPILNDIDYIVHLQRQDAKSNPRIYVKARPRHHALETVVIGDDSELVFAYLREWYEDHPLDIDDIIADADAQAKHRRAIGY